MAKADLWHSFGLWDGGECVSMVCAIMVPGSQMLGSEDSFNHLVHLRLA